jgi:hypothetical protein
MKRRTFLASAALTVAALAGLRIGMSSTEQAIAKILYKRLNYLKLDPDGVQRFAADLARLRAVSPTRLLTIDAVGPLYTHLGLSENNRVGLAIRHGEDRVLGAYLISSDFFINNADETRVVKYLGYFDPLRPCSNPFARLVVDESSPRA